MSEDQEYIFLISELNVALAVHGTPTVMPEIGL